jgi:hypothetical protein
MLFDMWHQSKIMQKGGTEPGGEVGEQRGFELRNPKIVLPYVAKF